MRGRGTSQRDRNIIVTGVVIAIVVIFVFAGSVWYLIATVDPVPDVDHITVTIASPDVMQQSRGGTTWWDTTMNFNKVTPRDATVRWDGVFLVVKSSSGSVLNTETPLQPDLLDYDDGADGTIDVEFWYIETGGDPSLTAGDAIKITGLSVAYEGATIEVMFRGERIGSATLPTNFP